MNELAIELERDEYAHLLSWVRDGLEHITSEVDSSQADYLRTKIDEVLAKWNTLKANYNLESHE